MRNYGFDVTNVVIAPEDFVLGSTSTLPNIKYREDGQWPTPLYEPQAETYETQGCTIWGGQNQIEMFVKEVYGFEPNFDERFNYLYCNVGERGANPQNFYQSVRHNGLIDDELLPPTFEEFKNKNYLTPQRVQKGIEWKDVQFELYHDWLTDTSKESIKDNLVFSPIALSVSAWYQDDEGLYKGFGANNHWCVCFGYLEEWKGKKGIYLKIFDSYDHSVKILHPDHYIAFAKRIWLRKRETGEAEVIQSTFYSLWVAGILSFFSDWLTLFKKEKLAEPTPRETVPDTTPKKESKITLWAEAIADFESGGDKNSISHRRNNPGNIKNSEGSFIVYPTYEAGFAALCNYLVRACTNDHKAYVQKAAQLKLRSSGDLTLYQFIQVYAPDPEPIPTNYANFIAQRCGVTKDTPIKSLL